MVVLSNSFSLLDGNSFSLLDENDTIYAMGDRISELPDKLLWNILSRLRLREAVATKILSRRWRYLWNFTTTLNFGCDPYFSPPKRSVRGPFMVAERSQQAERIMAVVEKHTGPKLEEFTICCIMDYHLQKYAKEWFQFAMKKNVEKLHFEFEVSRWSQYHLPKLGTPRQDILSKSLRDLYLSNVGLNDENFEYLLSNCPVLEKLVVINSHTTCNLRVVGPLALKELRIEHMSRRREFGVRRGILESIEIRDAQLVKFSYSGGPFDLHLRNVPFLDNVSIDILEKYCFDTEESDEWGKDRRLTVSIDFIKGVCTQLELSGCLSRLQSLKLNVSALKYEENDVLMLLKDLKSKVAPDCKLDIAY